MSPSLTVRVACFGFHKLIYGGSSENSYAPKVHRNLACGIATGTVRRQSKRHRRGVIDGSICLVLRRRVAAYTIYLSCPAALPQAKLQRTFGAKQVSQRTLKRDHSSNFRTSWEVVFLQLSHLKLGRGQARLSDCK